MAARGWLLFISGLTAGSIAGWLIGRNPGVTHHALPVANISQVEPSFEDRENIEMTSGSSMVPAKVLAIQGEPSAQIASTPLQFEPAARQEDDAAERVRTAAMKVEKQHGDFLKQLSARGGDATTFRALLIERQMISSDILSAGRTQGINTSDRQQAKALFDFIKQSVSEFNLHIKQSVPESDYKAWIEWERIKPDFQVGAELKRRLESTGSALTPPQHDAVTKVLIETKDPSGWTKVISVMDPDGAPTLFRIVPESAMERIRPILTPEQFARFSQLVEEHRRISTSGRGPVPPTW